MKNSCKISKHTNTPNISSTELENILASNIQTTLETTPFFCNILVDLYENVQLDNSINESENISSTRTVLFHQHSVENYIDPNGDEIIFQDEQPLNDTIKLTTPNVQDGEDVSYWNQSTVMSSSPNFSEPRLYSSMSSQSSLSEENTKEEIRSKSEVHLNANSRSVQDFLLSYKSLSTNTDPYNSPLVEISAHISSSNVKIKNNIPKSNNNDSLSTRASSNNSKSNLIKGVIHECNICNKKFQRPSTLETHMNVHSGEKPFLCPFLDCKKLFNARSNMLRHLKMHFKLGKGKYLLPSGEISSKKPTAKQLICFTNPTGNNVT